MATKTKRRKRGRTGKNRVRQDADAVSGNGEPVVEEAPVQERTAPPEGLSAEERIVRILRHGENIHSEQVLEALLEFVENLPMPQAKAAAIVTASHEIRWAEFSGEETPDTEYPTEVQDMQIDPEPSKELNARIMITKGKVALEDAKGEALARIFWENAIEPSTSRVDRRNALAVAMETLEKEKPELPQVADDEVSNAEFDAIIFKHRRALEVLELCVDPDSFDKKSTIGEAVLQVIEKIEGQRERAVILGVTLNKMTTAQIKEELKKTAEHILGANRHGMPSGVTFMGPNGPIDEDQTGSGDLFADLPPNLAAAFIGRGRRSPL